MNAQPIMLFTYKMQFIKDMQFIPYISDLIDFY